MVDTPHHAHPPALGALMHVTIDCVDAEKLAAFWCALTGHQVAHRVGPFVFLRGATRDELSYAFQQVPEPTAGKPRLHVDFRVADLGAARARVEGLGGTITAEQDEMGAHWLVAADPEGNPFCLVGPSREV